MVKIQGNNIRNNMNKSYKKAQMNQVFVYVFSIIVILFAGFLVTKFLIAFMDDTDNYAETKFYETFDNNFYTVYSSYGSEKVYEYKISNDIKIVCFINKIDSSCDSSLSDFNNNTKDDMKIVVETGENMMMFDKEGLIDSHKADKSFYIDGGDSCLCIEPNHGKFSMVFENIKNKVYISENDI